MTLRVVTVLGTRPEIIRLSRLVPLLDQHCQHTLVHTGQNFSDSLSDMFFRDLGLRAPDVHLDAHKPAFGPQMAAIVEGVDAVFAEKQPDRVVVLGDTDSGLAAIAAARRGIPVFHLEAGNRCYDTRVPEEVNRRIIDQCSAVLMPYTRRSAENLVREGFPRQRVFVIGNPIFEVLEHYRAQIEASAVLQRLGLTRGRFALATIHRAENVDVPERLAELVRALTAVADRTSLPVIVSVHPRTGIRMTSGGISVQRKDVRLLDPLPLFDFVSLEQAAAVVITDSGTVQEECCIFGVPNVTVRDTSERMETLECGSNIIAGVDAAEVVRSVDIAMALGGGWAPPAEYLDRHVSHTAARIILGPVHDKLPT